MGTPPVLNGADLPPQLLDLPLVAGSCNFSGHRQCPSHVPSYRYSVSGTCSCDVSQLPSVRTGSVLEDRPTGLAHMTPGMC